MFLGVGSFGWWIVAGFVLQGIKRVFEKFFGENFKRGLPQRFDTKRFQTMPVRPPAIENMQCLSSMLSVPVYVLYICKKSSVFG